HNGVFIFADSTGNVLTSTTSNQFLIRASGGITMYTNAAANVGVMVMPGSGTWSSISDRAAKENFADVNEREILERVAALPIQTWNYKSQGPAIRHIGPTAQDFYAAFGVGEDDRHITTVDADGVTLAAIQGLYQLVQEKDAQIAALERELNALREAQGGRQPVNVSNVIAVAALLVSAVTLYRARKGGQR
ncbi:MAG: tail fiber domain-containing protein, partial [Anaerolineales bacterium]|nr:tail fiber domain-containing protein [Anaerolineales bacterium]